MTSDGPIVVGGLVIPAGELEWRFDPSGGPGGQHANRSNTRVELAWDLEGSASLDDDTRARLLRGLGDRLRDGRLTVIAAESRSQWRNRSIARSRLASAISDALRPEPAPRRPTKPSRAAHRRRVERKRRRGETKRLRRRPE